MKIFLADYMKHISLQETLLKQGNTIYIHYNSEFNKDVEPFFGKEVFNCGLAEKYPNKYLIADDTDSIEKAVQECDFGMLIALPFLNTSAIEEMFVKHNKVLINSTKFSPRKLELDRFYAKSLDLGFDKADCITVTKDNYKNIPLKKNRYVIKPLNEINSDINYMLRTVITNNNDELLSILDKDLYGHLKSGGAVLEEYIDCDEIDCSFYWDGSKIVGDVIFAHKEYKGVLDNNRTNTLSDECGAVIYPLMLSRLSEKTLTIVNKVCSYIKKESPNHKGFIGLGLIVKESNIYLLEITVRAGDPTESAISRIVDYTEFLRCVATGDTYTRDINSQYNVFVGMFPYGMPYNLGTSVKRKVKDQNVLDSLIINGLCYKEGVAYYTEFAVSILCVGMDSDITRAIHSAYKVLHKVDDNTLIYRNDIGNGFLKSLYNILGK